MGQAVGKARIQPDALSFINLPTSLVVDLRQAVYEISEGYGLTLAEAKEVIRISLREFLRIPESQIDEYSEALFNIFNADASPESKESLIDSFEFLCALCIVSGMQLKEKINFIFDLFDFNETGQLTINEATLAFRASASGTTKVSLQTMPIKIDNIDQVAIEGFEISAPANLKHSPAIASENHTLNKEDFFQFVMNCPESLSLMNHFDDIIQRQTDYTEKTSTYISTLRFRIPNEIPEPNVAHQPWRDQIRLLKPNCDAHSDVHSPPMHGLSLDWIYGRNTGTAAIYGKHKYIFYPAGSMVVKLYAGNDRESTQDFFSEHSGHVTSIDIFQFHDALGETIVSADTGTDAKICVWSTENLYSIVSFKCFHTASIMFAVFFAGAIYLIIGLTEAGRIAPKLQNGTSTISFSNSGELLLSLGNNDLTSIAVHKWREKSLLFTSKIPGNGVYDISFLGSDNSFGVCGKDAVYFWTRLKSNMPYNKHRGVFKRLSSREVMTCITCVGSVVVTGSSSGRLWAWEGRICRNLLEAFNSGPITRMHSPRTNNVDHVGLCVSTHDGVVYLFNKKLEIQSRFSANNNHCGDNERIIDTIFWNYNDGKVLVGQKNDLYEVISHSENASRRVMCGHMAVTGLVAVNNGHVITVGNNGDVKLWDTHTHCVLRQSRVKASLSCVSYNHSGDQVAIGFGTNGAQPNLAEKSYVILSGDLEVVIHAGRNSQKSLTTCKHSNDGKLLAFGSDDSNIYIHACTEKGFPLIAKARGHSCSISSIDFGCSSSCTSAAFIRSNSVNREAMFWTIKGKQQTPLSQRDTLWESLTCKFSWCMEEAHNSCDKIKSNTISSCCRYFINDKQSIIVGDSSGDLRIFTHPVIFKGQVYLMYRGHSGIVHNIQFCKDSRLVHSLSRDDSCLFQWKSSNLNWDKDSSSIVDSLDIKSIKKCASKPIAPLSKTPDMQTMINQMNDLDFSDKSDTKPKEDVRPSTRPWKRQIVSPSDYSPTVGHHSDGTLSLVRIHGYSGRKIRNNLHYLGDYGIVYNVGKVLVQYDIKEDMQHFCNDSSGDITCLSVNTEKSICAIGQVNAAACIIVIGLTTMRSLSFLSGHEGKVTCLDFDESGKYLVSIGNGSNETVIIHDWENGTILASAQSFGLETLDAKFTIGDTISIIQCGISFIRFWSMKGSFLSFEDVPLATFDNNHAQYFCCIGRQGTSLLVGTSCGRLIKFDRKNPDKKFKAHSSAVTSISPGSEGFVTGSSDGFVKVWSASMKCVLSINLHSLGIHNQISSICWNKEHERIFVGSTGNEIWELSSNDGSNMNENGGPLTNCHSSSHTMGLSMNPNGCGFATCGDDGVLRVWDLFDHSKNNSKIELHMPSRSCAFSPDGDLLCIGFGKPEKEDAKVINGKWSILSMKDSANYQIIAERRDARGYIVEIKWHSQGNRFAVGSDDKKICVYGITTTTKPATSVDISLLSIIDQLRSPAIHFDFSRDGKYLQVNCQSYELLFYEAGPGLHIKESSLMKDIVWDTNTCTFAWCVQGVWSQTEWDTNITTLDCSESSVVTGDSRGRLKMYQLPCTSNAAQFSVYLSHLGPVAKVRWSAGASHLVTTGNAIMIWRHDVDDEIISNSNDGRNIECIRNPKADFLIPTSHHFNKFDTGVGTRATESSIQQNVTLFHAYGYDTLGMCNSCMYDSTGDIVYPTSSICALFDKNTNRQTSFQQHETLISAICCTRSRRIVASGDLGSNSKIRLWDSQTCTQICKLSSPREAGVSLLSFSSDDKRLVSTDECRRIYVWKTLNGEWNDAFLYVEALGGHDQIYFTHFTAFASSTNYLITGGKNHINFWSEKNSNLLLSKGVLPNEYSDETFTCAATVDEKIVVGTTCGSFIIFENKKIAKDIKAHNDGVLCLCACPEGIISGSLDNTVTVWTKELQKIGSFEVSSSVSPFDKAVCALDFQSDLHGASTTKILVGTRSSNIYEISRTTGHVSPVIENHCFGQVNAVSFNPTNQDQFATVGEDRALRVWSMEQNAAIRRTTARLPLNAVDWSRDGNELLVGCGELDGMSEYRFMILNASDLSTVYTGKDSDHKITAAKYSPDNTIFVCASADYKLHVHSNTLESKYKLISVADKHNSIITAIDFTIDSQWIQSKAHKEVICFGTKTGEPLVSSSQLKSLSWATNTCIRRPQCMGEIIPAARGNSPQEITAPWCSQLSSDGSLLVVGHASGQIELFDDSNSHEHQPSRIFRAHCGQVGQCILSTTNDILITVGKFDHTVFVWNIKKK